MPLFLDNMQEMLVICVKMLVNAYITYIFAYNVHYHVGFANITCIFANITLLTCIISWDFTNNTGDLPPFDLFIFNSRVTSRYFNL
jgi:hypothetical protein